MGKSNDLTQTHRKKAKHNNNDKKGMNAEHRTKERVKGNRKNKIKRKHIKEQKKNTETIKENKKKIQQEYHSILTKRRICLKKTEGRAKERANKY